MVSSWMKENILDKGLENLRFFAQMELITAVVPGVMALTSGDKSTWVECMINESRYMVADGYKITLIPLDRRFAYRDYYQEDFESLLKQGFIVQKDNDAMHIQHIKWNEYLGGNLFVVHEADVIAQY